MPPISRLLERLQQDFSEYRFEAQDCFKWMPLTATIGYCLDGAEAGGGAGGSSGMDGGAAGGRHAGADSTRNQTACFDLLHELAHAQLGHAHYRFDIELLRQESGAWHLARLRLGPRYGVNITEAYVQDCLDSYREWLYSRSLCPECAQTGLQEPGGLYECLNCGQSWAVNEARRCALRRYLISE